MTSIETVRAVLGWCGLLNLAMLTAASLMLIVGGDSIKRVHAGMFGLSHDDLGRQYFQYLAQYKIAIFVFNLAPYLALRIIA